ncbi:MAG: hypothetical protein WBY88_05130, partial [Desulfosarcina sp.]
RDAQKELNMAGRDVERSQAAIEKIGQEIEALPVSRMLLENAPIIESLQHELGSFRKAQKDKPGLDGRMRTLQQQADDLIEEIGVDLSGQVTRELKLPASIVGEIQDLVKRYERLTAKQESALEQQRKLNIRFSQLTHQRRSMPGCVDVSRLVNALQSVIEAGPIEKQLADVCAVSEALEEQLKRTLKRQTLWHGSLAHIDELPLPSKETIDLFDAHFEALRHRLEKQRETRSSTEDQIAQTQADLQAIDLSYNVPTETDLKNARDLRDKGWGLIRQRLAGQTPPVEELPEIWRRVDPVSDLPDAFENSMFQADHIADRLRRESDHVSRKGLLAAQKEKSEKTLAGVAAALEASLARQHQLEAEWQRLWDPAGIAAQTPREMRGWLSEMASLRDKRVDLRSQKSQTDRLTAQLAALKSELSLALDAVGVPRDRNHSLSLLVKTAQVYIKTQSDLESALASAERELASLKAQLEEGDSAIADLAGARSRWEKSWQRSLQTIGIRIDATPTAALAIIESMREVRSKINEADVLRKRIDGIDRDCAEFISRVRDWVETLAPDLTAESCDRAAELLNGRLTQARKDESRRAGLMERLNSSKKEQADAQRRLFECTALIESLCKEANCADAESLAETEKQARRRKVMAREINDLDRQLRRLSAGATVDAFIDDASTMEADRMAYELEELERASEDLEKERSALDQTIGALKARLDQMDGSSQAAICAENVERLLAGLESDVEAYARLKMASIILSRTVEQYREKHQGPLISRASELFAQMTLGAFKCLRADYDDKGNPVLVGLRSETGAPVNVEGMSDGTADQLYLALRLASLEQYLENNEPLPFVVDDILLRFDDRRALATLNVLAGLADKTQILFFTHHHHLVALAEHAEAPHLQFNLFRL